MTWLVLGLLASPPALAGNKESVNAVERARAAESHRLENDLDRLAQKLSWEGVERTYRKLLELQIPLTTHVHYTAALSAEARGDVRLAWRRLERALRDVPALKEKRDGMVDFTKTLPEHVVEFDGEGAAARDALNRLKSAFGMVNIEVSPNRLPALVRLGSKPFTQTEREAIKGAQQEVSGTRTFDGPLPVGRYMVDGQMFEVSHTDPVEVRVGL